MSRWWKGMALVAASWLGLGGPLWAQYAHIPSPVGATRMPEPLSAAHPAGNVPSNLVPGPITPLQAPPGPGPDCWLPSTHSSAFQCEDFPAERAFYAAVGSQALARDRLGHAPVFYNDRSAALDTGQGIPASLVPSPAIRFADVLTTMDFGVRATVGYLVGGHAIEATGYYIFQKSHSRVLVDPGNVTAPFIVAPNGLEQAILTGQTGVPLGLAGNNGLWAQADVGEVRLTTAVGSAELNYRSWNVGINGFDLLLGVRYLYVRDKLEIFTDDEGLTFRDIFGRPDPRRQATYLVDSRSNLLTLQVGGEYAAPLPTRLLDWIWFGINGRVGLGPNLLHCRQALVRGDAFVNFSRTFERVTFGQVYDTGAFFDFHILDRLRLRAGYNAMFVMGVAVSDDQVDFNLANPRRLSDRGSYFFHGPMMEFQFLF